MSAIATAVIGSAVIGGVVANANANKAISAQKDAAAAAKVDINALDEQTRKIAQQNAKDSAALEQQLTPEVPKLRTAANNAVISGLNNNTLGNLQSQSYQSPLLQAAVQKAYSDLQLGGKLGVDQQNLVTRNALANAGSVANGTLGLGRDLTARDLGISSLNLEQQRLNNASNLGQQDINSQFNRAQLIGQLNNLQFNQGLSAAGYGQSIRQPTVGLDPSSIANLTIGNGNIQANSILGQNNARIQANNAYGQAATSFIGGLSGFVGSGTGASSGSGGFTPYAKTGGLTGSGYSQAPYSFGGK